ncbi:MAG: hypothetical protein RIG63_23805 [Coleofasciculus chthonoplastes F3-SA18-01]|uniref:hypothetical protein n=1 Tax=Coleofasciculus chthonoplastes TaxID=64178 RepID=UPI0032F2D79A
MQSVTFGQNCRRLPRISEEAGGGEAEVRGRRGAEAEGWRKKICYLETATSGDWGTLHGVRVHGA